MEMWLWNFVFAVVVTISAQRSITDVQEENSSSFENDYAAMSSYEQTSDANCSCNWRFLGHYEAKGCQIVEENDCGCPVKFQCPNANEIEQNYKACLYKGKEYAINAVINTTNPCQVCRCSGGSNVRIICSHVECPQQAQPLDSNCHFVYEKTRCCPVKTECSSAESNDELQSPKITCEYNGQIYPLGARIYPEDDPCQTCVCTESWNGTSNSNCFYQDCIFERNKSKLQQGCIPIYHEKTCCPIEFYCSPDDEFISKQGAEELELSENDSKCIFEGQSYEVGKTISLNHATNCVSCTCVIPPDFTCIHQSCTPAPSEENCFPHYDSHHCCPQYDCALGDEAEVNNSTYPIVETFNKREMEGAETLSIGPPHSENACNEIYCSEDTTCVLYQVMCGNDTCPPVPTCLKINSSCPTPQCAPGCVVIEHDESNCPTCVCDEEIKTHAANIKCKLPQCVGQNCHLVAGNDGCPICSCDEPCSVTECPPGCNVLSEVEGRCPQCVCEDETEGCPTPLCENSSCSIEIPVGATCPTCVCGNIELCPTPVCEHENCQIGRAKGGCLTCFCVLQESPTTVATESNQVEQQLQIQQQLNGESESSFVQENSESSDYDTISIISKRSNHNNNSEKEKLVDRKMIDMMGDNGEQEFEEEIASSHATKSLLVSNEASEHLSAEKPIAESDAQNENGDTHNPNAIDSINSDAEVVAMQSEVFSSVTETLNDSTDAEYNIKNDLPNNSVNENTTEADESMISTSLNTDIKNESIMHIVTCPPVQCKGYDCYIVKESSCHVCICKAKCPPPICNDNCEIQDNTENECPSCVCHIPHVGIRQEP